MVQKWSFLVLKVSILGAQGGDSDDSGDPGDSVHRQNTSSPPLGTVTFAQNRQESPLCQESPRIASLSRTASLSRIGHGKPSWALKRAWEVFLGVKAGVGTRFVDKAGVGTRLVDKAGPGRQMRR